MINVQGEIRLKKGKEYSVHRYHPWIFSGAIQALSHPLTQGAWVKVVDQKGQVLGFGHYQEGTITVRMLVFGETPPSDNFWMEKLQAASLHRKILGLAELETNAWRLVHGEGDGLPGLIIDYYNGVAVVQAHSHGMHQDRQEIMLGLQRLFQNDLTAVYYKSHGTLSPGAEEINDEYLFGTGSLPHTITEYGHRFYVDWETGQKTGFFLDQRENRYELSKLCRGRKVLNTFCYTGGFSVYALSGGAELVHSVDSSTRAIELTKQNLECNGYDASGHACYAEDTFDFLKKRGSQYDVIVLDPPAFAKHRDARHQAVKGYQRLNAEAIRMIKTGGLIFTFSCSQVVDRKLFYDTIVSSAIQSGRNVKVLRHFGQPGDHPVSLFHPEGEYLKGLLLYVSG